MDGDEVAFEGDIGHAHGERVFGPGCGGESRVFGPDIELERTLGAGVARAEAAVVGGEAGDAVGDIAERALEDVVFAHEGGDEAVDRVIVDFARIGDLLEPAVAHDAHTVGHGERFALVVGDVDEGHAGAFLDRAQFGAHVLAQLEVERGERFVEQHDGGFDGERAGDGDALLLPARKLADHLVGGAGQVDELEEVFGAGAAGGAVDAAHLEPEGDVVGHRHERKEREVLEDQRGGALVRAGAAHVLAADPDRTLGRVGEARDHAQDRGLAAA